MDHTISPSLKEVVCAAAVLTKMASNENTSTTVEHCLPTRCLFMEVELTETELITLMNL